MFYLESDSFDAAFYFSVEEYFTRFIKTDSPVLMLWQTDKTVMLGNNQVLAAEVDVDYAKQNDIKIVRRSSGGGAIYTDYGTVLCTVIQPLQNEPEDYREKLAALVINALAEMGVNAVREGKNDVLIDGKKISGFAEYTLAQHVCTHCSLLYDTDLEMLSGVLIPNENKLKPKGIASIRSRVTNIKPLVNADYSTDEFICKIKESLLSDTDSSVYKLSSDELGKINEIQYEKYANRDWNFRM